MEGQGHGDRCAARRPGGPQWKPRECKWIVQLVKGDVMESFKTFYSIKNAMVDKPFFPTADNSGYIAAQIWYDEGLRLHAGIDSQWYSM